MMASNQPPSSGQKRCTRVQMSSLTTRGGAAGPEDFAALGALTALGVTAFATLVAALAAACPQRRVGAHTHSRASGWLRQIVYGDRAGCHQLNRAFAAQ
jgi:hypothetical protein